jgi:LPPG:FO 2-phospho-L-lactate transferase
MTVVALAGGIGAARFIRGLVQVTDPRRLVVVANTGDDIELHGLYVSPDLDTLTYTLGGGVDAAQGWGRADESFTVQTELGERYGESGWFTLGDRDIATHLVRTRTLAAGGSLSQATAAIARAWELPFRLLPMSDQRVTTRIATRDGRVLHFQEWWVGERARPDVDEVRLEGIEHAGPAPGVLEAIGTADAVVLCPSNPVVSIGPILAVPGVREALASRPVVGVSPIVGGQVVRGMADRLLPSVGVEVSAAGVARAYADVLDAWVVDETDRRLAGEVEEMGIAVGVTDTIMADDAVSAALARTALDLLAGVR